MQSVCGKCRTSHQVSLPVPGGVPRCGELARSRRMFFVNDQFRSWMFYSSVSRWLRLLFLISLTLNRITESLATNSALDKTVTMSSEMRPGSLAVDGNLSTNIKCLNGTYGQTCSEKCGQCLNMESCNNVIGTCNLCSPGYTGRLCKTECSNGTFGMNCSKQCGHCYRDEQCNVTSGECSGQCSSGYLGSHCNISCPNGTYGVNCTNRCGACLYNAPCDHVDGTCRQCEEGYTGHTCTEDASSKMYGTIIGSVIVPLSIVFVGIMLVSCKRNKKLLTPTCFGHANRTTNQHMQHVRFQALRK